MIIRLSVALLCLVSPVAAHVISMSSGYAKVNGNRIEYTLRMPEYEMPHVKDPRALFTHIRFTSGFETGRRTAEECHADSAGSTYICTANYEFSAPVERLDVQCSFYEVTVPNHIHMLHAERSGKYDQAILDAAFSSASLGFRPPTAFETAVEQSRAGAVRVWTNAVQVLLLVALALASRTRRELTLLGLAFLAGECAGALAILHSTWQPSPQFAESAAALALAYLALEIIAFPGSRGRWLLALMFGGFEGMYFASFVGESGYSAGWVLMGAALAGCVVLIVSGIALMAVADRYRLILSRIAASAMLVTGSVWFTMRLRG